MNLKKEQIQVMPEFFDRYIQQVPDLGIMDALEYSGDFTKFIPLEQLKSLGDKAYAPEKWAVKDILQHVVDLERVLAYRALWFARNGTGPLPSVDEDSFAGFTRANQRDLDELLAEFRSQRESSIWLFKSFDEEMVQRSGVAAGAQISVLALGFVIAGHAIHHTRIIKERYLPLLNN